MAAFATPSDLATYMQRDLSAAETATAELVLDLVSGAIRAYTGQTISTATSTAKRLKVRGTKVRLPQRPVTAVSAVTSTATPAVAVAYTWDGFGSIELDTYEHASVLVTYAHGYATIPDDIRAITLQVAGRSFGTTPDTTGVQSESIGGYSYSTGAATAQGAVGFLAGERAVLDRYKLPTGPILMERA